MFQRRRLHLPSSYSLLATLSRRLEGKRQSQSSADSCPAHLLEGTLPHNDHLPFFYPQKTSLFLDRETCKNKVLEPGSGVLADLDLSDL